MSEFTDLPFAPGSAFGGAASSVSEDVPSLYPIAIDGRAFELDEQPEYTHRFTIESIEISRQQSDTSDRPGESTINPEAPWRRSQESWALGAGQAFQDRKTSSPFRFRESKGINVHEEWELSLLNDTELFRESEESYLQCLRVGEFAYFVDGEDVEYTDDPFKESPSYESPDIWDMETPGTILHATTDGFLLYVVVPDGIHSIERGDDSGATVVHVWDNPASEDFTLAEYAKGRLIATNGLELYELPAGGSGTPPSPFFIHPNPDFVFTAIAASSSFIYAAGYSGDKSEIYAITITDTGTSLDAPIIACNLPDGEIVRSLDIYEDQVQIGIDGESVGIHLGRVTTGGGIVTGATIPTVKAPLAFEPQGRFVWYGASNFDADSTGLGRLNLRFDTSDSSQVPTPAYASDLMYTGQGDVTSIMTFGSKRIFSVAGEGFVREMDTRVATGYLDSGSIGYDLVEQKLGLFIDTQHESLLHGSYSVAVKINNGSFELLGTKSATSAGLNHPFNVQQQLAYLFEVRLTLNADTDDETLSPKIQRYTLKADPIADTGWFINLPLLLTTNLKVNGKLVYRDPIDDMTFIANLHETRRVVNLQFYEKVYSVEIRNVAFNVKHSSSTPNEKSVPKGTLLVQCKTVEGLS